MFYVYLLIDPITNLPFYAGKGKGNRAQYHILKNQQGKNTENPYKDNVIRQILAEGLIPIIEYIYYTNSEQEAYDIEELTIKKYGRRRYDADGILTNLCKDNRPPHLEYSEERKEKYRKMMQGNTINTGRVQTTIEKEKRSNSLKASYDSGRRVVTDKMREASKATHIGKIVSDKTRQLQSESAKLSKAWRIGKTNEEIYGKEKADEIRKKKLGRPAPNRKPITIDGNVYESISAAAKALQTTEYKVKQLNVSKKI